MIKFKDEKRHKDEFNQLDSKNPELKELLEDVSYWVSENLNNYIMITMIDRTDEEQDNLYKDDPKYQKKKFKSPHQGFWDATDLRSLNFKHNEITRIVDYINEKYNKTNKYGWTAKFHVIPGGAPHFHIQFRKKG